MQNFITALPPPQTYDFLKLLNLLDKNNKNEREKERIAVEQLFLLGKLDTDQFYKENIVKLS